MIVFSSVYVTKMIDFLTFYLFDLTLKCLSHFRVKLWALRVRRADGADRWLVPAVQSRPRNHPLFSLRNFFPSINQTNFSEYLLVGCESVSVYVCLCESVLFSNSGRGENASIEEINVRAFQRLFCLFFFFF